MLTLECRVPTALPDRVPFSKDFPSNQVGLDESPWQPWQARRKEYFKCTLPFKGDRVPIDTR